MCEGQKSAPVLAPEKRCRLFRDGLKIRSHHHHFLILTLAIFLLSVLKSPHFFMFRHADSGPDIQSLYHILFILMLDIKLPPNLVLHSPWTLLFHLRNLKNWLYSHWFHFYQGS